MDNITQSPGSTSESLFRPNKRRKVFRKRGVDEASQIADEESSTVNVKEESKLRRSRDGRQDEDNDDETSFTVKRPTARKYGVGFSSTSRQVPTTAINEEMSMVPFQESQREEDIPALQSDRFIKPSGKVGVVEDDRHLTAYIDSKMAEMRSSAMSNNTILLISSRSDTEAPLSGPPSATATSMSFGLKTSSNVVIQPTTHARKNQRRPHRQPLPRDATSIARESLVDQILSETPVPLYDRSSTTKSAAPPSSTNVPGDADEAAAEAFKAEFLANLAEQNRRRPPPPPAVKGAQTVSSGPKLGGSRAQREKMKAMEEAKAAAGKK